MGVIVAARGEESNAGTGTPRAGGGTAPGGRSVAVAETTPCSSLSVGIGERPRIGGGGGAPEGRVGPGAGPERRVGPSVPKLLGGTRGASVSRAGSWGVALALLGRAETVGAGARNPPGAVGRVEAASAARGAMAGILTVVDEAEDAAGGLATRASRCGS